MPLRALFLLPLLLLTSAVDAQTRRIGHRSHSGKQATYAHSRLTDDYGLDTRRMKEYAVEQDSVRQRISADSAANLMMKQKTAPKPKSRKNTAR